MLRVMWFILCCVPALSHVVAEQPDIVVILADDFGVGDIQAHYYVIDPATLPKSPDESVHQAPNGMAGCLTLESASTSLR